MPVPNGSLPVSRARAVVTSSGIGCGRGLPATGGTGEVVPFSAACRTPSSTVKSLPTCCVTAAMAPSRTDPVERSSVRSASARSWVPSRRLYSARPPDSARPLVTHAPGFSNSRSLLAANACALRSFDSWRISRRAASPVTPAVPFSVRATSPTTKVPSPSFTTACAPASVKGFSGFSSFT